MNGHVCCILGVCCPPGSQEQRNALKDELVAEGLPESEAQVAATVILKNFDLAPKGSLDQFKSDVARLAREQKP